MSNMLEWAEQELKLAGYDFKDNGPNSWVAENVLELLKVFSNQGHSGSSAPFAISLFEKLANWKPIAPLTGDADEWVEVGNEVWQNKRNSTVFKEANRFDGKPYWIDAKVFWEWFSAPDIDDGKPYKVYFTNRDSMVEIEFPWTQPESQYIFSPTDKFPNEVL